MNKREDLDFGHSFLLKSPDFIKTTQDVLMKCKEATKTQTIAKKEESEDLTVEPDKPYPGVNVPLSEDLRNSIAYGAQERKSYNFVGGRKPVKRIRRPEVKNLAKE